MKVTEYFKKAKRENKTYISMEIIPPKVLLSYEEDLEELVDELVELDAPDITPFIDVTSHIPKKEYKETKDGKIEKKILKRPGTDVISAVIQGINKRDVMPDAVPHALCGNFNKSETLEFLANVHYIGVRNILAVKGDGEREKPKDRKENWTDKEVNWRAIDLVKEIVKYNKAAKNRFIEKFGKNHKKRDPTFCIGVAGYPEKHFQAPNIETDIHFLKEKVDAGADYIVTQMFFDNKYFFEFKRKCKKAGIKVPIIPGIKIISYKSEVFYNPKTLMKSVPEAFHVDIPYGLSEPIRNAETKDEVKELGISWTIKQVQELIDKKEPIVHFYVMNTAEHLKGVVKKLKR